MVAVAELLVFVAGAAVSLSASYLLVTRLERIGEWLGLSEGLLGVLAALAGDGPEITAAVAALAMHQNQVGAGVVIGSNVFNLAALLGLGAMVAGAIALHRRVVLLGGAVGIWVAAAIRADADQSSRLSSPHHTDGAGRESPAACLSGGFPAAEPAA